MRMKDATAFVPAKGPIGSAYQLVNGDETKTFVRTPFGHRLCAEPIGSAVMLLQGTYQRIQQLQRQILMWVMGISFAVGLALGLLT